MTPVNINFQDIILDSQHYLTNIENHFMAENSNLRININESKQENGQVRQTLNELLDKQKVTQYLYMDACAELKVQASVTKLAHDELDEKLSKCLHISNVAKCHAQTKLKISRNAFQEVLDTNDLELQPIFEIDKHIRHLKQEIKSIMQNIERLKIEKKNFLLDDKHRDMEYKKLVACFLSIHTKQKMNIYWNECFLSKMN